MRKLSIIGVLIAILINCTSNKKEETYLKEFPDTLKVAFTRDGVLIDSVWTKAWNIPKDSDDGVYMFICGNGDALVYNLRGKFVKYIRCKHNMDGAGIHEEYNYKP